MSSNEIIEYLVVRMSSDPLNPQYNFDAAVEYEKLNQTASAVGFYLRTVEYGFETHPMLAYASLLRISICMESQKDRNWTVSNTLLQAISFLPARPEAYFLMSKFHEKLKQWQEAYTFAVMGTLYSTRSMDPLPLDVGYIGHESLLFQQAVSLWWIGRSDESVMLLLTLSNNPKLTPEYKQAVETNLKNLGIGA